MAEEAVLRPGALALVTGASSGIGRAIAEALLERRLRVICTARRRGPLEEAFAARGDQVLILPLDATDGAAVAALPESLPADWREIDVLIANAGSDVGGRRPFDRGEIEDWAGTIETNVTGVIRICHALLPGMLARGHGHLVTLGSTAGLQSSAEHAIYSTSKHAVHAFTDLLRKDYKRAPLRITEVMPGMVRTGFAAARHRGDADKAEAFYQSWPAVLEARDIAAATLFALEQPPHVNIAQILVTPTGDK